jgi:hypothetical protein
MGSPIPAHECRDQGEGHRRRREKFQISSSFIACSRHNVRPYAHSRSLTGVLVPVPASRILWDCPYKTVPPSWEGGTTGVMGSKPDAFLRLG